MSEWCGPVAQRGRRTRARISVTQSGTGVSVEAVDHAFQTTMLDMLKQTGRYVRVRRTVNAHPTRNKPTRDRQHHKLMAIAHTSRSSENEKVVGWYHSHPGFGCWLSGVDINTQQVRGRHICAACALAAGTWC